MLKTFQMLPKWQNFAKSGHTDDQAQVPAKRTLLTTDLNLHLQRLRAKVRTT